MTKRDKALKFLQEAFDPFGSNRGKVLLDIMPEAIVQAIEIMTAKPKRGEHTDGSMLWDYYERLYVAKYRFKPKRNSTTNNQAKQLVVRLGLEDAKAVVEFYLRQTNAFYVQKMHLIGHCLHDAEALFAQMSRGGAVTRKGAEKIESAGATLDASRSYLNRKYAERPGQTTQEEEPS